MATAKYDQNGVNTSVASTVASLRVVETLDVTLAAVTSRTTVAADTSVTAVPFVITNTGNGIEAFDLAASTDKTAATVKGLALDVDGSGSYDPATDTLLSGTVLPALAPGMRHRVLILVAGAANAGGDVTVSATARATTGSGAAGTVFAGQGDGGSDAIVGKTGAAATAQALLATAPNPPTLAKSQSVVAPDGSTKAMRGSTVTYTLVAHFNAATAAPVVVDPVPASTRYVAGSLTLDGRTLSDAADGDAGSFDGSAVRVAIGDVAAAGDHTITFQTTIQ